MQQAGIKGVIFADAGNAFSEQDQLFYLNRSEADRPLAYMIGSGKPVHPWLGLYYSVGFGFRWFSPMGPLRFEWGIPITKRRPEDRDVLFEFTMGNFF